MKPRFVRSASLLAILIATAVSASAAPITYTISTTASGIFDGSFFSNALLTLTARGDTDAVTQNNGMFNGVFMLDVTATITVDGIGTDSLVDSLSAFSYNPDALFGIADNSVQANVLQISGPGLGSYDLSSAIGPVVGQTDGNQGFIFGTSRGFLQIDSFGTGTFQAAFVPSSTPGPMAALPFALMALKRRKRA